MEVQKNYNGSTKKLRQLIMAKEKRKKTKMLQFRVTPEDYKLFEAMAKEKDKTKTELFDMFLELIKDSRV